MPDEVPHACPRNLRARHGDGHNFNWWQKPTENINATRTKASVTFHVGKKTFEGRTQNVSRGGLCATLADSLPVGVDIDISITLVFDDEMQSEALRVPARIVWWHRLVDEANQVGISFRPLDAKRSEYLGVFLRYLDDRRTEKRPRDLSVDDRFR